MIYNLNGTVLNVPDDKVSWFEQQYPNAQVRMSAGGHDFDVALDKKQWAMDQGFQPSVVQDQVQQATGQQPTPGMETMAQQNQEAQQEQAQQAPQQPSYSHIHGADMYRQMGQEKQAEYNRRKAFSEEDYDGLAETVKDMMTSGFKSREQLQQSLAGMYQETMSKTAKDNIRKAIDALYKDDIDKTLASAEDLERRQLAHPKQMQEAAQAVVARGVDPQADPEGYKAAIRDYFANEGWGDPYANEYNADISTARRIARETKRLSNKVDKMATGKGFRNTGLGIAQQAATATTYSMGLSDMLDAGAAIKLNKKLESGEPLTEMEQTIADALYLQQEYQGAIMQAMPRGFKAGETFTASLPFMLTFMANPAAGMGTTMEGKALVGEVAKTAGTRAAVEARAAIKAATGSPMANAVIKDIAQKYGITGAKALGNRYVARLAGDAASAFILSNTIQAPTTLKKILDEHNGELKLGEDGKYYYAGDASWLESVYRGEMSQFIENFSEMMGEWGIGQFAARWGSKGLDKMGLGRVTEVINKISDSKFATGLSEQLERMGWHGTLGEIMEEEYGILMDALFLGAPDGEMGKTLKEGFSLDNQIDIALGIGLFGGLAGAAKTAGWSNEVHKYKKKLQQISDQNKAKDPKWQQTQDMIDGLSYDELEMKLAATIMEARRQGKVDANGQIQDEQLKMIKDYVGALMTYRGASLARELMPRNEYQQAVDSYYENGYSMTDPEKVKIEYEREKVALEEVRGPEYVEMIDRNPQAFINSGVTLEPVVINYMNAKAAYEGMMQGINDGVDARVRQAVNLVNANDNNGQQIQARTVTGDNVHIVSGNVKTQEDGTIIPAGSDESLVIRYENGKLKMVDAKKIKQVTGQISTQQLADQVYNQTKQQLMHEYYDMMQGNVNPVQGQSYDIMMEGQVVNATVDQIVSSPEAGVMLELTTPNGPMTLPLQAFQNAVKDAKGEQVNQQLNQRDIRQEYPMNKQITLPDGNLGTVTSELDDEGMITVNWDKPVNGKYNGKYTPEQLQQMSQAPVETPQTPEVNTATALTPEQQAYRDFADKYGEESGNKIEVALADISSRLEKEKATLAQLDQQRRDLPPAYDEASAQAEDAAVQAIAAQREKVQALEQKKAEFTSLQQQHTAAQQPAAESPVQHTAQTQRTAQDAINEMLKTAEDRLAMSNIQREFDNTIYQEVVAKANNETDKVNQLRQQKKDLVRRAIELVSPESTVDVLTVDEAIEKGSKNVKRMLKNAKKNRVVVPGWNENGKIYVNSDHVSSISLIIDTFAHERQHTLFNTEAVQKYVDQLDNVATLKELRQIVQALSQTNVYNSADKLTLMDETIAHVMEEAYKGNSIASIMARTGVDNKEIESIFEQLYNEQRTSENLRQAERGRWLSANNDSNPGQSDSRQNGRAQESESKPVAGQGYRPARGSGEGTGHGRITPKKQTLADRKKPKFKVVYHGSAANFDKFDTAFMSTGEGNQAYGWGIYVSSNKETGKEYARLVSGTNTGQVDMDKATAKDFIAMDIDYAMEVGISFEEAKKQLLGRMKAFPDEERKYTMQELSEFNKTDLGKYGMRHLYTVDIPGDNGENYLHWNQPLTKSQQNTIVKGLMDQYGDRIREDYGEDAETEVRNAFKGATGSQVEGALDYFLGKDIDYATGVDKNAQAKSEFLSSLGFVGMQVDIDNNGGKRYPGSNYVIYDVNNANILENTRFAVKIAQNDPFYSNAAKALEGIQQNKATAEQWLAMLQKNGGLKAGEDKWLGLGDWLKEQQGPVMKSDILDYISKNAIKVEDVKYSEYGMPERAEDLENNEFVSEELDYLQEDFEKYKQEFYESGEPYDENDVYETEAVNYAIDKLFGDKRESIEDKILNINGNGIKINAWANPADVYKALGLDIPEEKTINDTRLIYTSRGLTNKREIALTVPTIEPYTTGNLPDVHFADDATKGKAVAWSRFGDAMYYPNRQEGIDLENIRQERRKAYNDYTEELVAKYNLTDYFDLYDVATTEEKEKMDQLEASLEEVWGTKSNWLDEEKRVLVIDEIQSQRHQDGREKGYKNPGAKERYFKAVDTRTAVMKHIIKKYGLDEWTTYSGIITSDEVSETDKEGFKLAHEAVKEAKKDFDKAGDVPSAPFEKNWHELAMKRMLRLAAEEGYDKIAWTSGEQQADRYDIGTVYRMIIHRGNEFEFYSYSNEPEFTLSVDNEGVVTKSDANTFVGKSLSDIVGKELAVEMMTMESESSIDLHNQRIGGEGMKAFYDKILVDFMNKYGKKWGVKVQDIKLDFVEDNKYTWHSIDVTPEMVQSVMEGQPMFKVVGTTGLQTAANLGDTESLLRLQNLEVAKKMAADLNPNWNKAFDEAALKIKMATGWEIGADGMWRYEMGDGNINVDTWNTFRTFRNQYGSVKMGELWEDEQLYKMYPDLKDKAIFKTKQNEQANGLEGRWNGAYFELSNRLSAIDTRKTLVHEIQHYIQQVEGYARGGNQNMSTEGTRALAAEQDASAKQFGDKVAKEHPEMDGWLYGFMTTIRRDVTETLYYDLEVLRAYEAAMKKYPKVFEGQTETDVRGWLSSFSPNGKEILRSRFAKFYPEVDVYNNREYPVANALYDINRNKWRMFSKCPANLDDVKKMRQTIYDITSDYGEWIKGWNEKWKKFGLEGWSYGGKIGLEAYQHLAGEEESRNMENRIVFTDEERRSTLLSATEDHPRELFIFRTIENGMEELTTQEDIESSTRFKVVTDKATLDRLSSEPTILVYRAMQLIDGKLYPPMSAYENGVLREPSVIGQYEESEEHPEMADSNGYFLLDKGNGKKIKARYNPYFHTSRTPLNDQFSSAQDRPNIVIVEVEIPVSELTSGYHADKAKDSVGEKNWHTGPISSILHDAGNSRKVILSRWAKPVRIVEYSEIADVADKMMNDTYLRNTPLPTNAFAPELRDELEKKGYTFVQTDNDGMTENGKSWAKEYGKQSQQYKDFMKQKSKKFKKVGGVFVYEQIQHDLETKYVEPAPALATRFSVTPQYMDQWVEAFRKFTGSTATIESIIRDTNRLQRICENNDALARFLSYGVSFRTTKEGPLRTNSDIYVFSLDMDTSCPRTLYFRELNNRLVRALGRPLYYSEAINLMNLIREVGSLPPCFYCYVETGRAAFNHSFANYFDKRHAVLSSMKKGKFDKEAALPNMYSYEEGKELPAAAARVLDIWGKEAVREDKYNPTIEEFWKQYQESRNIIMDYLDQYAKENPGAITPTMDDQVLVDIVNKHFGLDEKVKDWGENRRDHIWKKGVDKGASYETGVADICSEWLYNHIAEKKPLDSGVLARKTLTPEALFIYADAQGYAQAASNGKKVLPYEPYMGQYLNLSEDQVKRQIANDGVRIHSSNDFRWDYAHDYILAFKDMEVRGLPAQMYTKNIGCARFVANTGCGVNISLALHGDFRTGIRPNESEGAEWAEAIKLKREYAANADGTVRLGKEKDGKRMEYKGTIGLMCMVTNDDQLAWALNNPDIDMIIPFHRSNLSPDAYYNLRAWRDYQSVQSEKYNGAITDEMLKQAKEYAKSKTWYGKDGKELSMSKNGQEILNMAFEELANNNGWNVKAILTEAGNKSKAPHFLPEKHAISGGIEIPGHHNSKEEYLQLCEQYGVKPRFDGVQVLAPDGKTMINVVDHPRYMMLVREVATAKEKVSVPAIRCQFDVYDENIAALNMTYTDANGEQQKVETAFDYMIAMQESTSNAGAVDEEGRRQGYDYTNYTDPWGIEQMFLDPENKMIGKDVKIGTRPELIRKQLEDGLEQAEGTQKEAMLNYLGQKQAYERAAIRDSFSDATRYMVGRGKNKRPSQLSHAAWLDVRMPEFTQRFGDWKNGKGRIMLNEDGEPVVVEREYNYNNDLQDANDISPMGHVNYYDVTMKDGSIEQFAFYPPLQELLDKNGGPTNPGVPRFSVKGNYTPEMQAIKDAAIADGTFMKAPNGQPTNLNERQWLQVRTQNFKDWFGDWEKDPENASKVVDENGEPRVVYHGSDWNPLAEKPGKAVFDEDRVGQNFENVDVDYNFFFTASEHFASTYGENVTPVFLNIRNMERNVVDYRGSKVDAGAAFEALILAHDVGEGEIQNTMPVDTPDGTMYTLRFVNDGEAMAAYKKAVNEWEKEHDVEIADKIVNIEKKIVKEKDKIDALRMQVKDILKDDKDVQEYFDTFGKKGNNIDDLIIRMVDMMIDYRPDLADLKKQRDEVKAKLDKLYKEHFDLEYRQNIEGYPQLEDFQTKEETSEYHDTDVYACDASNQIKSATDNNGEFSTTNPDIRFKVTPQQDAEYMAAVKAGDMDKAQKMVRDAFKAAYPNNKLGAKVFYKGKNGEWKNQVAGYFTDDEEFAYHYGFGDTKQFFLNMENPYEYDFKESGSDGDYEGADGEYRNTYDVTRKADKEAADNGLAPYDGYILRNVGEGAVPGLYVVDDYIVNDPVNVKSAETVTYDDEGNIIPLSQRFQPVRDVRYKVTPAMDAEFQAAYEAGDKVKAMELVKAAFLAKYPNTKVVDEDGMPKVLWHAGTFTTDGRYVPIISDEWMHFGTKQAAIDRANWKLNDFTFGGIPAGFKKVNGKYGWDIGGYGTIQDIVNDIEAGVYEKPSDEDMETILSVPEEFDTEEEAEEASQILRDLLNPVYKRVRKTIEEGENPNAIDREKEPYNTVFTPVFLNVENPSYERDRGEWGGYLKSLEFSDYDGIYYTNGWEDKGSTSWAVKNPNQVKSAEPFTFDDNGDLIPLSERFNEENNDIRFKVTTAEQQPVKAIAIAAGTDYSVSTEPSKVKSRYDNGHITVFNPESEEDIEAAVMRESFTHKSVKDLKGWEEFRSNVYSIGGSELTELAKSKGWDFEAAIDEWMLANTDKLIPSFLTLLHQNGIDLNYEMTPGELRMYLTPVRDYLDRADVETIKNDMETKPMPRFKVMAVTAYENAENAWLSKFQRGWVDHLNALDHLQQAIMLEHGSKLSDGEDAHEFMIQMSSRSQGQFTRFNHRYFDPLMTWIRTRTTGPGSVMSEEDLYRYMMAKHGLERNVVFARRDAERFAEDVDSMNLFRQGIYDKPAKIQEKLDRNEQRYQAGKIEVSTYNSNKAKLEKELQIAGNEVAMVKAMSEDELKDYAKYVKENEFRQKDYSGLIALTGMSTLADAEQYARDMVDDAEQRLPDYFKFWDRIKEINKATLDIAYQAGQITKEQMDHLNGMFEYYIPLRGFEEKTADEVYDYYEHKSNAYQKLVKKAKGRKSIAANPLANMMNMAQSAIFSANKNRAKQQLLNMVENYPTTLAVTQKVWLVNTGSKQKPRWELRYPDIAEGSTAEEVAIAIANYKAEMQRLKLEGKAHEDTNKLRLPYRSINHTQDEHMIRVMRNGQEYVIIINGNPKAAQAINGLTNPDLRLGKNELALRKLQRLYASLLTSKAPNFTISNGLRDRTFARLAVLAKEDPAYAKEFEKNLWQSMRTFGLVKNWNAGKLSNAAKDRDKWDRYWREFITNGAETGFTRVLSERDYENAIKQTLGEQDWLKKGWNGILDGIEYLNRSIEDMTRFACYVTSREQGRSIQRSVSDAKNITANFNRKGSGEMGQSVAADLYMFVNAAVQGMVSLNQAAGLSLGIKDNGKFGAKVDKKRLAKMVPLLSGAIVQGILFAALAAMMSSHDGDDDDKKNGNGCYYDMLSDYEKRNNIIIYVGNGKFVKIPLGMEFRAFYGLGSTLFDVTTGRSDQNALLSFGLALAELIPVNIVESNGLVPDVLSPAWEAYISNKDYAGIPVYKEYSNNSDMPEWAKAYNNTAKWLVGGTKALSEMTGGTDNVHGDINLNPARIQHLVEGYGGGLISFANQLFATGKGALDWTLGEEHEFTTPMNRIPFLNRIMSDTDERTDKSRVQNMYYKYLKEATTASRRLKDYTNAAAAEAGTKSSEKVDRLVDFYASPEYQAMQIIEAYKKYIKKYQDADMVDDAVELMREMNNKVMEIYKNNKEQNNE